MHDIISIYLGNLLVSMHLVIDILQWSFIGHQYNYLIYLHVDFCKTMIDFYGKIT